MFASGMSYAQIAEVRGNRTDEHQERHLPHPGEAGGQLEAGARGLGRGARAPG